MIKVVFFAALREKLSCSELSIDAANITTVAEVKQYLIDNNPNWRQHLDNTALLTAVNSDMAFAQQAVNTGDEVAFFPPVTGG